MTGQHRRPPARLVADADLIDPDPVLVRPRGLTMDGEHSEAAARRLVHLAQLLYTFWDTGDETYLDRAVDTSFVDRSAMAESPPGPAAVAGPARRLRREVPDLGCVLEDLIVAGNKFAARLSHRGHVGGRPVTIAAFEINYVGAGKIVEGWRLQGDTVAGQA
jgi:predicted ester cyclase